ncbi:MAG TPA: nucleotidyltransferase domain-containing protein [Longimicrobium sp.]|nr:nucleotidyltransferase domain-containing protein [Longimicrobium sp.]
MEERPTSELDLLQDKLGLRWDAIGRARGEADRTRAMLEDGLGRYGTEDTSVVVFGSLARGETTSGSDVDWTLLVDGQSYPEQSSAAGEMADWIDRRFRSPGREATFGGLAFSHDLINKIGGGEDSNRNLTQRILLLLESVPIGRDEAHTRVVRALLERYIHEDFGWLHSANPAQVPRFLQNDIARYWRTVAVDFAYKRHARAGEGWALRTAKLRLSRKLTYAAGLVACFQCAYLGERHPGYADLPVPERARIVVDALEEFLRKTPLEMMAWVFLRFETLAPHADDLFGSYDRFLALLDDEDTRTGLQALRQEAASEDGSFRELRELGHRFQRAPGEVFLPEDRGAFHELTRTYGVF